MTTPMTNAIVDNVIENISTKKRNIRCELCELDFTSQVVLDTHLQGARHAKQIRSTSIMESLQESKVEYSRNEETNGLKCHPCNVYLNSIQQLHTHLNGNRHKKKIAKGDWMDKDIVSRNGTEAATYIPVPEAKLLTCVPCNKFFNSESQLNMHLDSQKHASKINNTANIKKKRHAPYWKKGASNKSKLDQKAAGQTFFQSPLSTSFISSGYQIQL